jgi:hypothetical protein
MLVDMCSRAGKLVALDWVTACLPDIFFCRRRNHCTHGAKKR